MIILVAMLLLVSLSMIALAAKRRGASGGQIALIVVVGAVCTVVAMFAILAWGFSDFG